MGRSYDDRDDYDAPPASSGGATAVKILAIIGSVFLVVVIVCGGLGAFGIYMVVSAADRARQDLQKQLDKAMQGEQQRQRDLMQQRQRDMFKNAPPPQFDKK